eukprot:gnl/MRDRNA2_/MRDRNA2_70050_c0_seq1.p1 gnl/MRDRNA2_/MRDRNA2_70050_c0~~gnl/MRDRNA2_/MRDRNA2_70050_c0_seq1.p1  ORF type:complete len:516 (-),score=98.49 gnl/MRDRNA2_/MRDRNA2_70050_c0_seq1:248-1645(-)
MAIPTWSSLAEDAGQRAAAASKQLQVAGRRGTWNLAEGPPSAQARMRTFGTDPSKIRVTLYRDNHAWCPYCHKVWLQLEEKQIPHKVEKINMRCYGDKPREFLQKVPMGLLPVLEVDGEVITESSRIMQVLEDDFPEYKALLPPRGSKDRVEAEQCMQVERALFGTWLNWLRGEESPRAKKAFEQALDATEATLGQKGGPYFLGKEFSLIDCIFASTLERIAATMQYYKGFKVRDSRWPKVTAWFSEMEKRPTYRATQSDYHTHIHDLPPQIGGCIASDTSEQEKMAAALDGADGKSWSLPLPDPELSPEPLNPGILNPDVDRIEAALAFLQHRENIVRSASAAVGADEAVADEAYRTAVGALLREDDLPDQLAPEWSSEQGKVQAAQALRWTRDRICVPRDMSVTAARQMRAHLNLVADTLDPQQEGKPVPIPEYDRRDTDPSRFSGNAKPGGGILGSILGGLR